MLISDQQLSQIIVNQGLVDNKKLEDIIAFARNADLPLSEALLEKDILSDLELGQLLAAHLKLPFINLSELSIPHELCRIIPENIAKSQKVILFDRSPTEIKLALADPANTDIQQSVAQKTGTKVTPYLATHRDIENALKVYRQDVQQTFNSMLRNPEFVPVAEIADLLIEYAYQDKASDIHIEPDEKYCLIRFRLDGVLHDILRLPKPLHDRIVTRIKVLARLRTDEHLTPQDGRLRLQLTSENLDIRVSIVPVAEGEKVVLRLLSARSRQFSLMDLGMRSTDLKKVMNAISKSYGLVLATGPTGSGKTTSIYSLLKILNTRDKNITTIEDPVEYRLSGVNQIQVNPRSNLSFANGLRSILRQDPNIIFVGEIRDNDTAAIGVNAALTGHLVLSTLHTNDAATALPRFIDMKVEPFLVASTVNVVIAQRLVRKVCKHCRRPQEISLTDLRQLLPPDVLAHNFGRRPKITAFTGDGCDLCHHTGYSGRIGIFEVMEVTAAIRNLITDKKDSTLISDCAQKEGMTTMLDDGLQKVLTGDTTLDEILRVTKTETI
ncbi:Flp pilus assembly complex ATPase component TadA [Patescibacteria group bacterium]|nr:Flp pilus assembly complex ATPase component TadA [Patescibacteria group bacterium]